MKPRIFVINQYPETLYFRDSLKVVTSHEVWFGIEWRNGVVKKPYASIPEAMQMINLVNSMFGK